MVGIISLKSWLIIELGQLNELLAEEQYVATHKLCVLRNAAASVMEFHTAIGHE